MTTNRPESVSRLNKPKGGRLRGFIKSRKGTTAIEFALLAFPFSLLIFAILESCISFAAEEYMQNVTDDVARDFRVGKLKKATVTEAGIRKTICDQLEVFVSPGCPGLKIDLRNFTTFADAANLKSYVNAAGELQIDGGKFEFLPGPSQSKNILRVYYPWPIITDIMRPRMSIMKDEASASPELRNTLHFATATWQNEPFDD